MRYMITMADLEAYELWVLVYGRTTRDSFLTAGNWIIELGDRIKAQRSAAAMVLS